MTAVIFLSQVEAELVSQGRLAEPGYRRHPRARDFDREMELEDLGEEFDQQTDITGPIEQIASAHYWNRHTYERALMVSPVRLDSDSSFIGITVAAGGPRIGRHGVRRLSLGPWRIFPEHIPIKDVYGDLEPRDASTFLRILREEGHSRPLPTNLSSALNAALRRRVPEYSSLWNSLPNQPLPRILRHEQLARIDANQTALRLFSRSWRDLTPVPASSPSEFAINIEFATQGSEDDYITDDVSEFLGWDRSLRSAHGWWEFRKGNMRLHLKNINVSAAENHTGADLVYVRREPDTIVLVQYKLLETIASSGEPIFRPDSRLGSQIDRMLSFSPSSPDRGIDEADARLGTDFSFVKFILPTTAPYINQERPEGRYLPADAVRRMLALPDRGPSGGRVHFVYRRRYIDGETFARLVRDRWMGSTGDVTAMLLHIFGLQPSEHRVPRTLAIEEEVSGS